MPDIALSWTDNSDNEGAFNIYRSTTASPSFPGDYSQIDSVGANTTSYTDTGVSAGDLSYAVTASNAAGESDPTVVSILADTRSVGLSGTGAQTATRGGISKQRPVAIQGSAALALSRVVDRYRETTLTSAGGRVSVTRTSTKERMPTIVADGSVTASADLTEPFPSESTRDLSWDYNFDRRGFESDWSYQVGSEGAGSVAVYLHGMIGDNDPATPTVIVDYDASGDGGVDERSLPRSVPAADYPIVFPELSGRDGHYRLLLQDLRPDDILVAVTVGPTHT